jgi:hypothetical protein
MNSLNPFSIGDALSRDGGEESRTRLVANGAFPVATSPSGADRYARAITDVPTLPATDPDGTAFVVDDGWDTTPFTDDELTALALAADPDAPLSDDAVEVLPLNGTSALPGWYMPAAAIRLSARWQRPLIYAVIAAFLIIDAFGLCSTYG